MGRYRTRYADNELQWGRVVVDAEMAGHHIIGRGGYSLQWGRVVVDAEIDPGHQIRDAVVGLQWGRVVVDAEITISGGGA